MARRHSQEFAFSAKWVAWAHSTLAYTSFAVALATGLSLHYHKIVRNEFFGYPAEWFPSVSAAIGDRFPERSFFQILIAATSGPRFALIALWYLMSRTGKSSLPGLLLFFGLVRTLTCAGWVYITSTDNHHWHDIFMIAYIVTTAPWSYGCISFSKGAAKRTRQRIAGLFFGSLVPLVYLFVQHKVYRVPGAYTKYALVEWLLVLLDVAFDAVAIHELADYEIVFRQVSAGEKDAPIVAPASPQIDAASVRFGFASAWKALDSQTTEVLSQIFCSYVFWTNLTALGICIWYFPLWHMGISGYEVLLMCSISPFLLSIRPLARLASRHKRLLLFLSSSPLLAYTITSPTCRLLYLATGVSISCFTWASLFSGASLQRSQLKRLAASFCSGLLLSSISKYANHTNNPLWPILNSKSSGWNRSGLAIALVASWYAIKTHSSADIKLPPRPASSRKGLAWVGPSAGLGGALFLMHSLLSDSSTIISWVWDGFPARGPTAVPHGMAVILAMGCGILLGVFKPKYALARLSFVAGAVGAAVLTSYSHWTGFAGGLVFVVYLMAISPSFITTAAQFSPGKVFGAAFLVYNVMVLAHVWVVAYAFVPGGSIMRERTDLVMFASFLLVATGVRSARRANQEERIEKIDLDENEERVITTPPSSSKQTHEPRSKVYFGIIIALELLAGIITLTRLQTSEPQPYNPESKMMTAGIWTIHFSLDNDMWSSHNRMRDLIKDAQIDVLGLLESDLQRITMGNRDTTQFLAEDLGMYVDYGPGPNKHTWGAALLSKFPIVNSTHHLLPSPVGELAPAIHATLDAYGSLVDVFVFHSGQEEDEEDRRLQAEYMSRLMGSVPQGRPTILLSYLVVEPGEGNYNTYVSEESGMRDIDKMDHNRWCEYILYKNIYRSGYARISRSSITDTELQLGKFVVGSPDRQNNLKRLREQEVPSGLRFPTMFRGKGIRDHRYHVFTRPRYFG